MFVLFCACDMMNVLSVKKNENLQKKKLKKKQKKTHLIHTTRRVASVTVTLRFA
jgi:hypothetical protein